MSQLLPTIWQNRLGREHNMVDNEIIQVNLSDYNQIQPKRNSKLATWMVAAQSFTYSLPIPHHNAICLSMPRTKQNHVETKLIMKMDPICMRTLVPTESSTFSKPNATWGYIKDLMSTHTLRWKRWTYCMNYALGHEKDEKKRKTAGLWSAGLTLFGLSGGSVQFMP